MEITNSIQLNEDTFYEYFLPYRHPKSEHEIWGGIGLETYGKDYSLVCSLDWNYVWTVIDGADNPHQWITEGIHLVNRVCYLVTKVPHNGLGLEFMIPSRFRSLTPLGLKRQMNKLDNALKEHNKLLTLNI